MELEKFSLKPHRRFLHEDVVQELLLHWLTYDFLPDGMFGR